MEELEKRRLFLLNQLLTEKNKQKRIYYFHDLLLLDEIYKSFYHKTIIGDIWNTITQEDWLKERNAFFKEFQAFLNFYNEDRVFHQFFSKNVLRVEKNYSLLFQSRMYENIFTWKQMQEWILSFFAECIPQEFAFVKDFFEKDKFFWVYDSKMLGKNFNGATYYFYSYSDCMIMVSGIPSFEFLITLVHELGHAICYNKSHTKVETMEKGLYYEVYSVTLEQLFIEYMQKKNLFEQDILAYLCGANRLFQKNALKLDFISSIPYVLQVDETYIIRNQEEEVCKNPVMVSNQGEINFKEVLIYFYAQLLSLEYLEQYKNNPKEMFVHIKCLNEGNGVYNLEELFPMAGLSIEEVGKMKTLKKHLSMLKEKTSYR